MDELRDVAKIQLGMDTIPNVMSNQVVPVVDINPKHSKLADILVALVRSTTSSAVTIFAARPNQDVFITGIQLSCTQDVACDNTSTFISVTQNGAPLVICRLLRQTLTAQSSSIVVSFAKPIKIDRNTAILATGAFTVGAYSHSINITGYIESNANA